MQIKTASATLRLTIVSFFVFICINFAVLFFLFRNGIEIDSLDFGSAKVDGLYLSLDKKLMLHIASLELRDDPDTDSSTPLEKLKEILDDTKLILTYFQEIRIDHLAYDSQSASLLYNQSGFTLTSPDVSFEADFERQEDELLIHLTKARVRKSNLEANGTARLDLTTKAISFKGDAFIPDSIHAKANLHYDGRHLTFDLHSQPFTSMEFLKRIVDIPNPNVSPWIYTNVTGRQYQLEHLHGKIDIHTLPYEDLLTLDGYLTVKDANILYHPNLPKVTAKKVDVRLKNNTLYFSLHTPASSGVTLDGSRVTITDIFGDDAFLHLDLKGRHALDATIQRVLKTYAINAPLAQKSGKTDADIRLSINLSGYDTNATGTLSSEESDFSLNALDFHVTHATALLKGSNLEITQGRAQIGDYLDTDLKMHINTKERHIDGESFLHRFEINYDQKDILTLRELPFPFTIDYDANNTRLRVPALLATLDFSDTNRFTFEDISLLSPHSAFLQEKSLKEGNISLLTEDFADMTLQGTLKEMNIPLISEGEPITTLDTLIQITEDGADVEILNHPIRLHLNGKTTIAYENLDLDVDKALLDQNASTQTPEYLIKAANSAIHYKGRIFPSDHYTLSIDPAGTTLQLSHGEASLKLEKYKEDTFIDGKKLHDHLINSIIRQEIVKEGSFNIEAAESQGVLRGKVTFNDTKIKDFQSINNIFAFIDSIPSLVTFRSPGYADDGYLITDGELDFVYSQNVMVIENLFFKGGSVDMSGSGVLDFNEDSIEMHVTLHTIKSLSKIIDTIPIVGYIIMGDEGTISTGVSVEGNLSNPTVSSEFLEDTLKTPLNILKRIITSPLRLFKLDTQKEENNTSEED